MNSVEPQTMKKDSVILKYTLICMYVFYFLKIKLKISTVTNHSMTFM